MKLYHTSSAPIIWKDGELVFKNVYPPAQYGLHAWHDMKIAQERMGRPENDFLYSFEYPIDAIDDLPKIICAFIHEDTTEPKEIAVKLMEDTGAGVNKYHAVILDYSKITNWQELDANQASKYLTGELEDLNDNKPPPNELNCDMEMDNTKEASKTKKYLSYLGWTIALSLAAWFDYTSER